VIGILELGGSWTQPDLDQFSERNGLPKIQVTDVSVDGTIQNTPGVDPNADGEVALDIQVAAATYYYATGTLPTIKVFWAQNSFQAFATAIKQAAAEGCDVLSISWGSDEDAWEKFPDLAAEVEAAAAAATAEGMVLFAAAGDNSSSDGVPGANVDLPSACPHVIGCGGTSKTMFSEVVWGDGNPDGNGTGGGYSDIFGPQAWQINAPPRSTPGSGGRMVPDVAANADPNTGYLIVVNGTEVQIGGTSAVAPFYAGLFASFGQKLGWVTPTLWKNPKAFVDITQGSNGSYDATVGPDPCTGLGVPIGTAIAALFTGRPGIPNAPNIKQFVSTGESSDSICQVYSILKPILQVIEATPFFPSDWKSAINEFITAMENICKGAGTPNAVVQNATFEDQVRALNTQARFALGTYLQQPSAAPNAIEISGIASQLCPVYKAIKPILDIIKTFVPAPWKLGIEIAEEVFDQICGGASSTSARLKSYCRC
jgi:kumamolisin